MEINFGAKSRIIFDFWCDFLGPFWVPEVRPILGPSLITLKAGGLISGPEKGPGNGALKYTIFRARVERCRAVVRDLHDAVWASRACLA